MKKKKGKDDFIKRHEFPGGSKAFSDFIKSHLIYPQLALTNKIEGTVLVEHDVDFNGNVQNARIIRGIGSGCDEEALRIVHLLKFSAQNNHGTKISSRHKTKINFKLPATEKPTTVVQYNFVSAKTAKEEKKPGSVSYTITIKHP